MYNKRKRIVTIIVLATVLNLLFTGCSSKKSEPQELTIRLAIYQGVVNGPFFIMEEILKEKAPGIKLSYITTESAAAMNEAFIANNIDGASINITNFLIGYDKGIPYRILSSFTYGSNGIQTNAPDRIRSFADITAADKIAVSSPTGSSALLVYLAAQKYFGNHTAVDENLVVMPNEDAVLALINNSNITLHATELTNRIKENEEGCVTILDEKDIFESGMVNSYLVFDEDFYYENQDAVDALLSVMQEAVELFISRDKWALNIVVEKMGYDIEEILGTLNSGQLNYVFDNYTSIEVFADISSKIGLIESTPDVSELLFNYKGGQ